MDLVLRWSLGAAVEFMQHEGGACAGSIFPGHGRGWHTSALYRSSTGSGRVDVPLARLRCGRSGSVLVGRARAVARSRVSVVRLLVLKMRAISYNERPLCRYCCDSL